MQGTETGGKATSEVFQYLKISDGRLERYALVAVLNRILQSRPKHTTGKTNALQLSKLTRFCTFPPESTFQ